MKIKLSGSHQDNYMATNLRFVLLPRYFNGVTCEGLFTTEVLAGNFERWVVASCAND